MTSMPASRRARAMIFAPRSCPSRPGLATTTRILRLFTRGSLVSGAGAPAQPDPEPQRGEAERREAAHVDPRRGQRGAGALLRAGRRAAGRGARVGLAGGAAAARAAAPGGRGLD